MMTREQYILRKQEIEERMKESRRAQHNETAALNEKFEQALRDVDDERRRKRQALFDERNNLRLEIEGRYKDVRRALWTEDVQLVAQWREGLLQEGGAL